MSRIRILPPVLALLALAVCTSSAAALVPPQHEPLYDVAPQGPFPVGDAPTEVLSGSFEPTVRKINPTWHGFETHLVIAYAGGSRADLLYAARPRPGLRELGWSGVPADSSVLGGDESHLVALSPTAARGHIFNIAFYGKLVPRMTVRTGPDPVAAVFDDITYPPHGWNETELAIADRRTGQLQLFTRDAAKRLHPFGTVALGPEPTALAGGECCRPIFATTAGNNRLTVLSDFKEGEFRERHSIRVGSRPSALALGDLVPGDWEYEEVAVANRGSDDVTILDARGNGNDFHAIGTYPVGHEPVAIAALDIDQRAGDDLAVVNRGSNDVSILLSGRRGHFRSGGTYPVGRRPVALAAFDFNRSFAPDLAVVNHGSDDITVLSRRVDGNCRGHEAERVVGTKGPDRLFGIGQGPNETRGLGGDDLIEGRLGVDCLAGEGGDDTVRGGPQSDLIDGGPGDDELDGEMSSSGVQPPGGDTLIGGPGEDQIDGRKGDDRVLAADGERDRIDCGKGNDEAVVDRIDRTRNCERVRVSPAASRPAPKAAHPARSPHGRG